MKKKFFPLVVFLVFFIIFFFKQIIGGEVFYCCDNLLINIPAKLFWSRQILSGIIPFWNPYLFSGTPYLADINLSTLAPGNILFLILEPFRALTVVTLVHLFFAGVGTYWAARQLKYQKISSLMAAVIFGFSGTMITYTGNLPMIQVAAFLPWIFGSWVKYVAEPSKKSLLIIILLSTLQIFSGHIQLTFYTFLFVFSYALLFLKAPWQKKLLHLGGIALMIGLISGIQLQPFLEFAMQTTRIGKGFSYATAGSLPLTALLRFILPSVVGNIQQGSDWWQGGTVYGYVGIVSLLLACFGVCIKKKPQRFFLIIAVASLFAAFGSSTPFYRVLYEIIPGISVFRVPSHFLLLTTFCTALLAGSGWEFLSLHASQRIRDVTGHILFILSLLCVIIWLGFQLGGKDVLIHTVQSISNTKIQEKLHFLGSAGLIVLISGIFNNILLVGVELFLVDFSIRYLRKFGGIVIIILIFVDLWIYSSMNLLSLPSETIRTWQREQAQTVSTLKQYSMPGYRIYVHPSLYQSPYIKTFGTNSFTQETIWQMHSFRPNMLTNYDLPLVDGYASMISETYQKKFGVPANDPTGITIPDSDLSQLSLLGVRYILLPVRYIEDTNRPFPTTTFLWKNDTIALFENTEAQLPAKIPIPRYSFWNLGVLMSVAGVIVSMVLPIP